MLEQDLAQFWFIIEKKNTNKITFLSPLKNEHSQTGSNILVTGHMTGSGATT